MDKHGAGISTKCPLFLLTYLIKCRAKSKSPETLGPTFPIMHIQPSVQGGGQVHAGDWSMHAVTDLQSMSAYLLMIHTLKPYYIYHVQLLLTASIFETLPGINL